MSNWPLGAYERSVFRSGCLAPRRDPPPRGLEAMWTPELVWTLYRLLGTNLDCPAVQLFNQPQTTEWAAIAVGQHVTERRQNESLICLCINQSPRWQNRDKRRDLVNCEQLNYKSIGLFHAVCHCTTDNKAIGQSYRK